VKILEIIEKNPTTSIQEIAEHLKLTSRAIEKNISKLKMEGLLKIIGLAMGGHWEIIK
jgi:ATP-dependent DNA helicase RecG